jgi:hypothetical protein
MLGLAETLSERELREITRGQGSLPKAGEKKSFEIYGGNFFQIFTVAPTLGSNTGYVVVGSKTIEAGKSYLKDFFGEMGYKLLGDNGDPVIYAKGKKRLWLHPETTPLHLKPKKFEVGFIYAALSS